MGVCIDKSFLSTLSQQSESEAHQQSLKHPSKASYPVMAVRGEKVYQSGQIPNPNGLFSLQETAAIFLILLQDTSAAF